MSSIRNILVAAAACVAMTAPTSPALADPNGAVQQVRAATGRFHRLESAQAEGYAQFQGCVDEPGQGAMGTHFVNGEILGDPAIEPARPEALMYEQDDAGRYHLLGVEYIVFQDAWDATHSGPPSLFGQDFGLVPFPNRFGIPAFYELHVWAWKDNPSGVFLEWNPTVRCP